MITNRLTAVKWPVAHRKLWGRKMMIVTMFIVWSLPLLYVVMLFPTFTDVYYSGILGGFAYKVFSKI